MPPIADFLRVLKTRSRWLVLSGAGCSTESGIPDYRDERGAWKVRRPIEYRDFVGSEHIRQRYWARSHVGFQAISRARPNRAHHALSRLEAAGIVASVITQNVDGLHQRAGSQRVIDLHGRLDWVVCMRCPMRLLRSEYQARLAALNPDFASQEASLAPDGDADLKNVDYTQFVVPPCSECGGILKPDVVFFGETVPKTRTESAFSALHAAQGLLVVGSSLAVFSGYRFAREAAKLGIPIAIVNRGTTRADAEAAVKAEETCGPFLEQVANAVVTASK